jgi:hypothetical protein
LNIRIVFRAADMVGLAYGELMFCLIWAK